jgi:arsenite-transporting ATPase
VLGISIGNKITAVDAVPRLDALEIDPRSAAQRYRDRIVGPVRGVLPAAVVKGIEEQLSGACTTEIAAFDEFTNLLADARLDGTYDHIVFDTAPTGPQYKAALDALADPLRTRMVRAQSATLREAARTHDELAAIGLSRQYLVINGVLPCAEATQDRLAQAILDREQAALASTPDNLKALPCDLLALKPFNLVGLAALHGLFSEAAPLAPTGDDAPFVFSAPTLSALVDEIALDGHGLLMLMGKGGGGKTSMAAAVAVELAHRGLAVHLTTSDAARRLAETLNGSLDNLTVSRIDPHAETERYRQQVLRTKGAKLDAAGRALLEEDLHSPCTEEIAVFQAFSRAIREAGKKFVVMDTAPTGHTLLLDATGAYHRDVARQMGESGATLSRL